MNNNTLIHSGYSEYILSCRPDAVADIKGSSKYPSINGYVEFYQTGYGVIIQAEVTGLPQPTNVCAGGIFAFHIHEGTVCMGNSDDSFAQAMGHYNPGNCPHPHHAGDMPPLFGNNGFAWQIFLTDRFKVTDIIGRAVIIHENPDDFTTQPSGNAGAKIACGIVRALPLHECIGSMRRN